MLALTSEVALASATESRVQKSPRLKVGREMVDMKWHNKDHLIIFPDGGVERMGVFAKEEAEEEEGGGVRQPAPPVLMPGDKLLESWVCDNKGNNIIVERAEMRMVIRILKSC